MKTSAGESARWMAWPGMSGEQRQYVIAELLANAIEAVGRPRRGEGS